VAAQYAVANGLMGRAVNAADRMVPANSGGSHIAEAHVGMSGGGPLGASGATLLFGVHIVVSGLLGRCNSTLMLF
jgi:hypothetical protein